VVVHSYLLLLVTISRRYVPCYLQVWYQACTASVMICSSLII